VDRHLDDAETGFAETEERLDLGCATRVRDAERGEGSPVRRVHPARRVVEGAAERCLHRSTKHRCPEPPARRGLVAVRLVSVAGREARSDRDVGLVGPDDCEEPDELVDRMLTVGVDPAGERVAV